MDPASLPALSARQRLGRMSVAWALLFASGPGFLTGDGSLAMGIVGLALWGATVLRPSSGKRRWAFLAEFLPNAIGGGALMAWVWYVFPGAFAYVAFGFGVYWSFTAFVVRLLARRANPTLAVALGVLGVETLRASLPPPFGLGWIQLGHLTHHHLWISTSAHTLGLVGLSAVVSHLGGLGASLLLRAHPDVRGRAHVPPREMLHGFAPLLLAAALSLTTEPLEERDGPLVLFVQPGFSQERKQFTDPRENFRDQLELTASALSALQADGQRPDLVVWAESMLYVNLYEPEVRAALDEGINTPPWAPDLAVPILDDLDEWQESWVRGQLLGRGPFARGGGAIPEGTAFLAGAELWNLVGEGEAREVRRRGALVLYPNETGAGDSEPPLERQLVLKRNLVPGAESMSGLEQVGVVRDTIMEIAAYVPDFVPGTEPGVLTLEAADGRLWRFGASICFDNAFLDVFTSCIDAPMRSEDYAEMRGIELPEDVPSEVVPGSGAYPLDFHLVASNEAWYRSSFEFDQMIAFSRIAALATRRTVARATNSGVTIVIGPDGTERARIRDAEGRDRATAGTLAVRLPVPTEVNRGLRTRYVRNERGLQVLGLLAPVLALLGRRRDA